MVKFTMVNGTAFECPGPGSKELEQELLKFMRSNDACRLYGRQQGGAEVPTYINSRYIVSAEVLPDEA